MGRSFFFIVIALCLFGFVMSALLTVQKMQAENGDPSLCLADGDGCSSVLTSKYGSVFGIPLGTWGGLYFLFVVLIMFLAAQEWFDFKTARLVLFAVVGVGVLGSVAFIGIMAFVLHQICSNCLIVHITNFVMAGFLFGHLFKQKKMY